MRPLVLRSIVLSVLLLVPAIARADGPDALGRPVTPEQLVVPEPPAAPSRDAPASVELALGVQPYTAFGAALGLGLVPGVDIGLALDPKVFLVVGASFSAYESDAYGSGTSLWIPLLVHVYLDTPRVGAIVPSIRAGVVGSVALLEDGRGYGGGVRVEGGVTWLADRAIALRLDIGGSIQLSYAEAIHHVDIWGALSGRASVVIRM